MTKNYVGILLALKVREDYSTEQHLCSENYCGDNLCVVVEKLFIYRIAKSVWSGIKSNNKFRA